MRRVGLPLASVLAGTLLLLALAAQDARIALAGLVPLLGLAGQKGARLGVSLAAAAFVALLALLPGLEDAQRVAGAMLALQLFLAAYLSVSARAPLALVAMLAAHALLASATVIAAREGIDAVVMLGWAAGVGALGVLALWRARVAVLAGAGLVAAGASSLAVALAFLHLSFDGVSAPLYASTLAALGAQSVALLAALASRSPRRLGDVRPSSRLARAASLASSARSLASVFAQAALLFVILNASVLLLAAYSPVSAKVLFLLVAAFVAFTVHLEYRLLLAAARRPGPGPAPALDEPLTAVIPARDDAQALASSLAENLALPGHVKFLLVPSTSSKDDTVRVAERLAAAHPGRIQVVHGTGLTKAEDLNLAWRHVATRFALVLDADETVDVASLARGVQRLQRAPGVGIVQGRKVSRTPDASALSRFIAAERRHSAGFDQPFQSTRGAGHFAGSGALLRREVGVELGWTSRTLTEDIELTLRMHLDGRWRIEVEPDMLVREADPATFSALVRQRTRWARGWMQCTARYAPEIWQRRKQLGPAHAASLLWLLFSAVSAPLMTLLPTALAMRAMGAGSYLPVLLAVPLSILVLPARLIGYTYAGLKDAAMPVKRTPARIAELALHAYLWVPMSWGLQLHAIWLECAVAARDWHVTERRPSSLATPRRARA